MMFSNMKGRRLHPILLGVAIRRWRGVGQFTARSSPRLSFPVQSSRTPGSARSWRGGRSRTVRNGLLGAMPGAVARGASATTTPREAPRKMRAMPNKVARRNVPTPKRCQIGEALESPWQSQRTATCTVRTSSRHSPAELHANPAHVATAPRRRTRTEGATARRSRRC
jgi:hypothetical protein